MPLRVQFRFPRFSKISLATPAATRFNGPAGRLHRVVERQRGVPVGTDFGRRLDRGRSEYSEPLYGASAYGSPLVLALED